MTFRTLRAWIVLTGLALVFTAALAASSLAYALAGAGCILGSLALVWLDGLRRSGRLPR